MHSTHTMAHMLSDVHGQSHGHSSVLQAQHKICHVWLQDVMLQAGDWSDAVARHSEGGHNALIHHTLINIHQPECTAE